MMNPDLTKLHPYPFEKLNRLKSEVSAPKDLSHIALSIGEPKHTSPQFVIDELANNLDKLANYPTTKGIPELRQTITNWLTQRFKLSTGSLDPERNALPVNGTREALFAITQACIDRSQKPLVVCPNPFYQIYEGAAFLAGAEPHFLACRAENNFIPDFDDVSDEIWQRCQLLFLCSPGNPTGSVINNATLKKLIDLSDRFNFVIASDECYSEIYFDEAQPPVGLLQACAELGRDDYKNCLVFHSLSKRSNLPGLRSGFVAGDATLLDKFLTYRTYHGCAMAIPNQYASIKAWNDEEHTIINRALYKQKFDAVLDIIGNSLNVQAPEASFYLWPETPIPEEEFAQRLFAEQHITILPGSYLSRDINGENPGSNRVRMALVATLDECVEAATRIKAFADSL